jgi:sarcosine oxidase, subunit beta
VVVNAAGPGSSLINRLADVVSDMAISHRPLRQEVHVTPAPSGFGPDEGTIVTDPGLGTYFRPHPGGTLLVGGTEPDCDPLEWVEDPSTYDPLPTAVGFERNVFRMARRLPTVGVPHRPVGLAGLYDVSDDWVPIYDKSSLAGFFMACGTSGNQFKNAPLVGSFLTALIDATAAGQDHDREPVRVRGQRTGLDIDLSAFSRRRTPTPPSGSVLG